MLFRSGKVSALSFNGNKVITTGGGGAILTNDEKKHQSLKHLTTTAKKSDPVEIIHEEIGFNYRLPNINAALGCAQLEQLPSFLERKKEIALRYEKTFESCKEFKFFKAQSVSKSNYWLNTIILEKPYVSEKRELILSAKSEGVELRPCWKPLHLLSMFESSPKMDLSITEDLADRIICLPSGMGLIKG